MDATIELLALGTRVTVFAALLGAFPRGIVPVSIRLTLALCLFLCFMPPMAGDRSDGEVLLLNLRLFETFFAGNAPLSSAVYSRLLFEVGAGALLSIAASAGMFAVELFARWFSRTVLGTSSSAGLSSLHSALCLLGMAALLYSPGLWQLWRFFGETFRLSLAEMQSRGAVEATSLAAGAGSFAFLIGGSLMLPFFLCSLLIDALTLAGKRYASDVFGREIALGAKAAALLLLLTLGIYFIAAIFSSAFQRSLGDESFRIPSATVSRP